MKYKYYKGNEADFDGYGDACFVVKQKISGEIYYLSMAYVGREEDIKKTGDIVIAHREPITDDEQDLNGCIGAPEAAIQDIPLRDIDGAVAIEYPGVERLITERGSRYGKFKDGAEIMQSLKDTMRDVDGWNNLTASQKEALDMIQHKIGRILNGDPTYDDSWKDIAGYATLIVNELNGEVK